MKVQIATIFFVLFLILINYQVENSLLKKKTSNLSKVNTESKINTKAEKTTEKTSEKASQARW